MSVLRFGGAFSLMPGGGKAAWLGAVERSLDGLEQQAVADGAHVDWQSVELETDTDFIDDSTMAGPVRELRITTLRVSALAVKT